MTVNSNSVINEEKLVVFGNGNIRINRKIKNNSILYYQQNKLESEGKIGS